MERTTQSRHTLARASTAIVLGALLCQACIGSIGDPGEQNANSGSDGGSRSDGRASGDAAVIMPNAPVTFACDPNARPPVESLRRLTMRQYQNTVHDLVAFALAGDTTATAAVMTEIAMPISGLPVDRPLVDNRDLHGSFRRLDQTFQQPDIDGAYAVGTAVGTALTTPARLGRVVGSCATDSNAGNDAMCLTQFIQHFGARALRRAITPDDVTFFQSVYGSNTQADPLAYADVINVMLNAPEMMLFVEHGDTQVANQPDLYQLSSYELASRLSYQFWDSMPDDELWQTASDGTLSQPSVFQHQLDRVFNDARTQATVTAFFTDWLKLNALHALDAYNADPTFRTFAGADLPSSTLRQEMIDDVSDMTNYYVWTQPSALGTLFTSPLSFARSPALARIYGVAAWDGTSAPAMFPSNERPGLLTRALFLSSIYEGGDVNTHPILKGVFIRRTILCDDISPPPPGANAHPPMLSPTLTSRQVVEQLTQQPGTVCVNCHGPTINPLGFATENFDSLGRHRTAQRMFDTSGNEVGTAPIDTTSIPRIVPSDTTPSMGPADLMNLIVGSHKPEACMARNYYRYTFARWEDLQVNGCALESMRSALETSSDMRQLLRAVALTQEFHERAFQ